MTTITTPSSLALVPSLETAWQDVDSSFERFCLTAGIGAIEQMLCEDAQQLAGAPHNRGGGSVGTAAQAEDWLGRWAMNLMLINVSTRKLRRAVRLPEGDLPVIAGDGASKSAASRRFVALSAERLAEYPKVCRLFIIDGAKALSKVIRRTFGAPTPIQRCQIHKARNVIERLPKPKSRLLCQL